MAVAGLGQQGILWEGLRGFAVHACAPSQVSHCCVGSTVSVRPWGLARKFSLGFSGSDLKLRFPNNGLGFLGYVLLGHECHS